MIVLESVDFTYNTDEQREAGVRELDLHIRAGECVVLCGKSGCGKTTVTRMINGLIPHFYEGELRGKALLDGTEIAAQPIAKTAERVGSVFQNPRSQFFNVDTTSELAFGCENQGLPLDEIQVRVENANRTFSLGGLMNRSIFELSGGEKQRIACGSVYAAQPDVFVMDEPSSNLDAALIDELRAVLSTLKAEGKTIVVAEYRLHYLCGIADRYIYMDSGRIAGEFSQTDLKTMGVAGLSALGLRTTNLNDMEQYGVPRMRSTATERLEIHDLVCRYKRKTVLAIPHLELRQGEIVAVIGGNGAGKSTFVHCLCGLQRHKGSIRLHEKPMSKKSRVGNSFMVMQDVNHQLFTESVMEEVVLNLPKDAKDAAADILRKLGLWDLKDVHPMTLSGGQKQRVAIAAAMCSGKKLLIFDEPTSGLDALGMQNICDVIADMSSSVFAAVIITHDLEFILGCCTSVLHIEDGCVVDYYPLDSKGVQQVKTYFIDRKSTRQGSIQMKAKAQNPLMALFSFIGDRKSKMTYSVILAILGEVCGIIPFIMVAGIAAQIFENTATVQSVALMAGGALAAQLLRSFLTWRSSLMSHDAAFSMLKSIRTAVAEKMRKVPMGVMLETPSGKFKNLIVDNVARLEDAVGHVIPEMTSNIAAPLLCMILIFALDWRMGLASLITIPLGFVFFFGMMRGYSEKMANYLKAGNDMNSALVEYVNGIQVIKAFGRSAGSFDKYSGSVNYFHHSVVSWYKQSWFWMAGAKAVMPSTLLGTLPIGALLYMNGSLSLSTFIACIIVPLGFIAPLMKIAMAGEEITMMSGSLGEITAFLQTPELKRPDTPAALQGHSYSFENVSFSYDDKKEVLHDITFRTIPGTMTAIVGSSGSGKSTIAKLMAGFWDATSGVVRYGGQDIQQIPFEQLMEEVSYVAQDNFLFDKSIRENIRMGNPQATDEEVIEVAKAAHCHDFILQLENGYDTLAGDAGDKLSGGERQRVTLARAMLKNSPVIILDEATSSVDPENEHELLEAIRELTKNKTLITIAHRLTTVRDADQIVVVDQGRIVQNGTHNELVRQDGMYRNFLKFRSEAIGWQL